MKSFQRFVLLFLILFTLASISYAKANPVVLRVIETTITVNGKKSQVFAITQPDGTFGYVGTKGQLFDVIVENRTQVPLVLHWHGIIDPNPQDGVPYVTQLPIPPGGNDHYQFKLLQSGTYWLHSHYKMQEQKLMAAPLIIHDPNDKPEKEVVMFVEDFTFGNPREIYAKLRKNLAATSMNQMQMPKMNLKQSKPDISDVKFDAYLTNHRTLQNPDIIYAAPKQSVRLRIINASSSSNYFVDLGKLQGTLIAVDGQAVKPIRGSRFQMAIGNRLDIRVQIPDGFGAYPIIALPEGTHQQTGLILATPNATIPKLPEITATANPILDYVQELKLNPLQSLKPHPVQRSLVFNLEGDMQSYRWSMNGQAWPYVTPYQIKSGERIELIFNNKTGMEHPMHFHGHFFQISEINGQKINGRLGDTINVMPYSSVKVIFDSDNPGIWVLHCHILYHQQGGMMTTINYEGYPDKFTTKQREEGDKLYKLSPF